MKTTKTEFVTEVLLYSNKEEGNKHNPYSLLSGTTKTHLWWSPKNILCVTGISAIIMIFPFSVSFFFKSSVMQLGFYSSMAARTNKIGVSLLQQKNHINCASAHGTHMTLFRVFQADTVNLFSTL